MESDEQQFEVEGELSNGYQQQEEEDYKESLPSILNNGARGFLALYSVGMGYAPSF